MAGASLLTLLDDIATVLDDVAVMTKIAAKKTAGVLGDDLALNAEQVTGIRAEREIPVIWAVTKGSFLNKLILVPAAMLISAFIPWLITPMLMLGGAYLCYEGFEKVAHKFLHSKQEDEQHHSELVEAIADPEVDMVQFEKDKIKGAIRTDFILSAEVIVIALGTVKDSAFATQATVVAIIAFLMVVVVYGIVAGIVKLDDAGLHLLQARTKNIWGKSKRALGSLLLWISPKLMKTLSIVGTIAMFLVGGGILLHGIPPAHHVMEAVVAQVNQLGTTGEMLSLLTPTLLNGLFGLLAGGLLVLVAMLGAGIIKPFRKA